METLQKCLGGGGGTQALHKFAKFIYIYLKRAISIRETAFGGSNFSRTEYYTFLLIATIEQTDYDVPVITNFQSTEIQYATR